jgi:hypothetical protein
MTRQRRSSAGPGQHNLSASFQPNKSKPDQAAPNESKLFCLVLFGFIRPNQGFSMG